MGAINDHLKREVNDLFVHHVPLLQYIAKVRKQNQSVIAQLGIIIMINQGVEPLITI